MKTFLLPAYIVLGCLIIVATLVTLISPDGSVWKDGALNMGTEIFGILLTLLLIERALAKHDEATQRRYARIAFERLRVPLTDHVRFWGKVAKASMAVLPSKLPASLQDLTTPSVLKEIESFDVYAAAPVYPPRQWSRYFIDEIDRFRSDLDKVVDKYAFFLSPDEVKLIEQCLATGFVRHMSTMFSLCSAGPVGQYGRVFVANVQGESRLV